MKVIKSHAVRILCMAVCMLCPFFMHGQDSEQAAQLMDSCVKRVKDMDSYMAHVTYSSPQINGEAEVSYLHGKYMLRMGEVERMCDGEYIYTVMKDVKEVNVENISSHTGALGSMSDILNIFVRNFKPYMAYDKNDTWVLTLLPLTQDREMQCVNIEVSKRTYIPTLIEEKLRTGQGTVIRVDKVVEDVPQDTSVYVFDEEKYKKEGYYIVRP